MLYAALALIASLWSGPPGRDADRDLEALLRQLSTGLGISFERCKGQNELEITLCGESPLPADDLRYYVDAVAEGSDLPFTATDWADDRKQIARVFSFGDPYVRVQILKKRNRIYLHHPISVPRTCSAQRIAEQEAATAALADLPPPELIPSSHAYPEYPGRPRQQRVGGKVELPAVIDTMGVPKHICVAKVDRRNMGFEYAAIEAVKQWRYEPVRHQGRPIVFPNRIVVDFYLQ